MRLIPDISALHESSKVKVPWFIDFDRMSWVDYHRTNSSKKPAFFPKVVLCAEYKKCTCFDESGLAFLAERLSGRIVGNGSEDPSFVLFPKKHIGRGGGEDRIKLLIFN